MRRRRAITLLKITTTQNVAWPTMIAGIPKRMNGTASTMDERAKGRDDPRKRDRENERERYGLPAEEAEPVDGERRQRAEHQSE